ncbi:Uncharacterized protein K02A2.6 [Eumeta japonica]|uniref:Uncharacterized protein K02A2.6 n=1 Tax=Eumeta variegata TaxID=151549 RepID=A0A4C1SMZ0_EUMVA|nr:Uncharacterized protein K02A2.6 [Eumeta japonica]
MTQLRKDLERKYKKDDVFLTTVRGGDADGQAGLRRYLNVYRRILDMKSRVENTVGVLHSDLRSCRLDTKTSFETGLFGGSLSFDHHTHDWEAFKVRLTQFCVANGVTDENDKNQRRRRTFLITALTEDTMRVASSLVAPDSLDAVPYERLVSLFDAHFMIKRSVFAERYNFYRAEQRPGEDVAEWAARRWSWSSPYSARARLRARSGRDSGGASSVGGVFALKTATGGQGAPLESASSGGRRRTVDVRGAPLSTSSVRCFVCGNANHNAKECRFANYKCNKCEKKGHLRRMCREKGDARASHYLAAELAGDVEGKLNKFKVQLQLKPDAKPIFFKPRPVPFALKPKVDEALDKLIETGILKSVNYSDYATPITPVLKSDGTVRVCGDYSVTLNKVLHIDRYPLPRIEELFARLHEGKEFSKLDLSMAYMQLELTEDSQPLTCINTHRGLFQFTRLVFGLSSAPAIFQKTMERILAGIEGICIFLDDILISGPNKDTHRKRLNEVLNRLQEAGPFARFAKMGAKWMWSEAHQSAFETVKRALESELALAHYDPRLSTVLTVDASPTGLGAVLAQQQEDGSESDSVRFSGAHPNPFVLKPIISHFYQYLGTKRDPEMTANRLQRYALFLSAYNYTVQYVRSANNVADYLSRSHPHARLPTGAARGHARRASMLRTGKLTRSGGPDRCGHRERSGRVRRVHGAAARPEVEWAPLADGAGIEPVLRRLSEMLGRFGLPRTIVTDNASPFTSARFRRYCEYDRCLSGAVDARPERAYEARLVVSTTPQAAYEHYNSDESDDDYTFVKMQSNADDRARQTEIETTTTRGADRADERQSAEDCGEELNISKTTPIRHHHRRKVKKAGIPCPVVVTVRRPRMRTRTPRLRPGVDTAAALPREIAFFAIKNKQEKHDAQLFARYLRLRPFRVRVWRVFSVDAALPLRLISLCTTYLIVVVQLTSFVLISY